MLHQDRAPLWDAVNEYKDVIPFHTPGHKLRSDLSFCQEVGEKLFSLDMSDEVESRAHDHEFPAVLGQAEALAARLFGAERCFFLVNGTTVGIHAMLWPFRRRVLIPRFSHQSVYGGLALSGAEPVYVSSRFDPYWQIPLPVEVEQVRFQLERDRQIEAVVVTHPSYYGMVSKLRDITSMVHQFGCKMLVDEAHGAHFSFSSCLPDDAMAAGADAATQSTHKNLGSLTQSSMLHLGSCSLANSTRRALSLLQSTSPSLLMLAVLDAVRREWAQHGGDLVQAALENSRRLRRGLEHLAGVEVLQAGVQDPTKVLFSLRSLGLTGTEVERILRRQYGIQVELSDRTNVLALVTYGDTKEAIDALVRAVAQISNRRHLMGRPLLLANMTQYPDIPQSLLSITEAMACSQEQTELSACCGRISSQFITPYPPGVPLVVPGEVIDANCIEYIQGSLRFGVAINGVEEGAVATVV